ncbi:MAG: hypothetical protein HY336_01240 [Candidatus Doudnabacteria bacterium]|nr:hypothetical protein [Candidatus Doudnabacteria bacterium]
MKKAWHQKSYDLEGWFHKHLLFKDDTEFIIFLVWSLVVGVIFFSLT